MPERGALIARIKDRARGRALVWVGVRGSDAEPLLVLDCLRHSFSLSAPLGSDTLESDIVLESMRGRRFDLNAYSTDSDESSEFRHFCRLFAAALGDSTLVMTYRPAAFVDSEAFIRRDRVTHIGAFHGFQRAFEHKPWVETELARLGVPMVPWRYCSSSSLAAVAAAIATGPQIARLQRSSGGIGLLRIEEPDQIPTSWLAPETLLSLAPDLSPNTSLNVTGCVFPSGGARFYGPSVQLVGIGVCTTRTFAYCGNDFGAARQVDGDVWARMQQYCLIIGRWLHSKGYVGTFGVDTLLHDGVLYVSEINPRFQGTSVLSARAAESIGISDAFLDQLAAFMGLEIPDAPPLTVQAQEQARLAQVIVFNTATSDVQRTKATVPISIVGLPEPDLVVEPHAMLFKLMSNDQVTSDGHSLAPEVEDEVRRLKEQLFAPAG